MLLFCEQTIRFMMQLLYELDLKDLPPFYMIVKTVFNRGD